MSLFHGPKLTKNACCWLNYHEILITCCKFYSQWKMADLCPLFYLFITLALFFIKLDQFPLLIITKECKLDQCLREERLLSWLTSPLVIIIPYHWLRLNVAVQETAFNSNLVFMLLQLLFQRCGNWTRWTLGQTVFLNDYRRAVNTPEKYWTHVWKRA